jgi:hypothetical protein
MTLIVTVNGPESIWLLADRRLSREGRSPKDDARKIMFLETTDGVAILGYAGLGATALGTEPADWMSAVLRGRPLPLEKSLGAIAAAMEKQFPRHMVQMPGPPGHDVIIPAFLNNEVRLYTIGLALSPDGKSHVRYTRFVADKPSSPTPRVALAGSGALYLNKKSKNWRHWRRSLLRVVRANDRSLVQPLAVADQLARLNNEVHLKDQSVGPRCIVAWRHRKGGVHKGGGGHQFYTGTTRDGVSSSLPTIANGMDVHALNEVMMPLMTKHLSEMLEAQRSGQAAKEMELDKDKLNAELARLPDKPDENLR